MSDLLEIENLSVSFDTPQGELEAVRDVSFSLRKGEVLALVGESGCGKSVLMQDHYEAASGRLRGSGREVSL